MVVPILGARRLEHLEANLAALEVNLRPDHVRMLEQRLCSDPRLPGADARRTTGNAAVRRQHSGR